jgi:hypothetical protein
LSLLSVEQVLWAVAFLQEPPASLRQVKTLDQRQLLSEGSMPHLEPLEEVMVSVKQA